MNRLMNRLMNGLMNGGRKAAAPYKPLHNLNTLYIQLNTLYIQAGGRLWGGGFPAACL